MSPPSSTAAKPTAERRSNDGRTWLERTLHRAAQRPACIRFSSDDGPGTGPAKPSGLGMVSGSQHTAGSATDARLAPRCCTLRLSVSPRRRWPGAVALVMWNMRKRHFSHSCKTAAARMAVKGGRSLPVHRSEAQTLDGHRSGGYARERAGTPVSASILCFQHVNAAATQGYSRSNREPPIFPLAALFSTCLPA